MLTRHRASAAAARSSTRAEVERLAAPRRRGGRAGALEVVVDTELTLSTPAGALYYRGRDATQLARESTFEAVAELLWDSATRTRRGARPADGAGVESPRPRPEGARPADRLRVVVAAAAAADPLRADRRPPAVRAVARTLIATMVDALPVRSGRATLDRGAAVVAPARRAADAASGCGRSTRRSSCSPTTSSRFRRSPRAWRRPRTPTPTSSCSPGCARRAARCTARAGTRWSGCWPAIQPPEDAARRARRAAGRPASRCRASATPSTATATRARTRCWRCSPAADPGALAVSDAVVRCAGPARRPGAERRLRARRALVGCGLVRRGAGAPAARPRAGRDRGRPRGRSPAAAFRPQALAERGARVLGRLDPGEQRLHGARARAVQRAAQGTEAGEDDEVGVGPRRRGDPRSERRGRELVVGEQDERRVERVQRRGAGRRVREARPQPRRDRAVARIGSRGQGVDERRDERPPDRTHCGGAAIVAQRVRRGSGGDDDPHPLDRPGALGQRGLGVLAHPRHLAGRAPRGVRVAGVPQQLRDLLERAEARELRRVAAAVVQRPAGVDERELRVDHHLQRARAPAVACAAGQSFDLRRVEARPAAVAVAMARQHAPAHVGVDGLGLHAQSAGGLRGRQHPLMLMQSTLTVQVLGSTLDPCPPKPLVSKASSPSPPRSPSPTATAVHCATGASTSASSRAACPSSASGACSSTATPTRARARRRGRPARPLRRRPRRPPGRRRDAGTRVGRRAAHRHRRRRPRDDLARTSSALLSFAAQSARGADLAPVPPAVVDEGRTLAEHFLLAWRGELDPVDARAIDAYWVSAAEHGMNASTFTARVVASTGADAAAALSAAMGALRPVARRRAPRVLRMLDESSAPATPLAG